MKERAEIIDLIYQNNLEINNNDKKLFLVVWILFGFIVLSSLMAFYYVFLANTTIY
ncbi:MAG: hypothetical protein H7174_07545 [Flavobacterium sp.]|nr:hypothetical protein [Flavobacterium sp.]